MPRTVLACAGASRTFYSEQVDLCMQLPIHAADLSKFFCWSVTSLLLGHALTCFESSAVGKLFFVLHTATAGYTAEILLCALSQSRAVFSKVNSRSLLN